MTDPITQAAAEAIEDNLGDLIRIDDAAVAVVAAVTPLIRAQIADEIQAIRTSRPSYDRAVLTGAAELIRRGNQ